MDTNVYSEAVIRRFMKKNMFMDDETLVRYYNKDNLSGYRNRLARVHKKENLEKMIYAVVTDSIRDIVYQMIGEMSDYLRKIGDLVISGGEAFNLYIERADRIVTADIDTKFVPRLKYDNKYFGKLQAIKLIIWDKLGEIAMRYDKKIKDRLTKKTKVFRFLGLGFPEKGPYVTRRYMLIKKKKIDNGPEPSKKDVFIDVELFSLDLKLRYFSPAKGKIEETVLGGILDMPLMRPGEFGYEVVESQKKGVTYKSNGKMIRDPRISVAGRRFLIDDVYLMQKLGLRPEKKEKDKQRLLKLSKMISSKFKLNSANSLESIYHRVHKFPMTAARRMKTDGVVSMKTAESLNPKKYMRYTTEPSETRLGRQMVYGLKASLRTINVPQYTKTHGSYRFNTNTQLWRRNTRSQYIKNEYTHRPANGINLPDDLIISKTLYGFNPRRDGWVSKKILSRSAQIPFVGLKN